MGNVVGGEAASIAGWVTSSLGSVTKAAGRWLYFKCDQGCSSTPWTVLSLPDLPLAWQAQLVQLLSPEDRKALFMCSHAAARMVLQHAWRTELKLTWHSKETKAAVARRQRVAMRMAEGARDLKLNLLYWGILVGPHQCLHTSITALIVWLLNSDDDTLKKLDVRSPRLTSLTIYSRTMLQDSLQLGAIFGHAIKRLRLEGCSLKASMLPRLAAQYPHVTHLEIVQYQWDQPRVAAEFLLNEWKSLQWLEVAGLDLQHELKCSRSFRQLTYRHAKLGNLVNLPLEAFKQVVLYGCLVLPRQGLPTMEAALVLNKLRCCNSLAITGYTGFWGPDGLKQALFMLEHPESSALAVALDVLSLVSCQPPSARVRIHCCILDATEWMPAMRHLPVGVSTLEFCQCRHGHEEQYWVEFAASLPAHVKDVLLQLETYQQAVAVVTAVGGMQHLNCLWLSMGEDVRLLPTDWQAQLSQLGSQLRPDLKLQLARDII